MLEVAKVRMDYWVECRCMLNAICHMDATLRYVGGWVERCLPKALTCSVNT